MGGPLSANECTISSTSTTRPCPASVSSRTADHRVDFELRASSKEEVWMREAEFGDSRPPQQLHQKGHDAQNRRSTEGWKPHPLRNGRHNIPGLRPRSERKIKRGTRWDDFYFLPGSDESPWSSTGRDRNFWRCERAFVPQPLHMNSHQVVPFHQHGQRCRR